MRDLEKWAKEQEWFERQPPHVQINIVQNRTTKALLSELQIIRWLLIAVFFVVVTLANAAAPGWWRSAWGW